MFNKASVDTSVDVSRLTGWTNLSSASAKRGPRVKYWFRGAVSPPPLHYTCQCSNRGAVAAVELACGSRRDFARSRNGARSKLISKVTRPMHEGVFSTWNCRQYVDAGHYYGRRRGCLPFSKRLLSSQPSNWFRPLPS